MEADDEDKGSESESEGEEDGEWIKFKLPPNEKSRKEIKKAAIDRDLTVVTHFHMNKLRKMKKSAESLKRQKVSASKPSSSSHPCDVVDDDYEDFLRFFNFPDFYNTIDKLAEEMLAVKDCGKQETNQKKNVEEDKKEEEEERVAEEEKKVNDDRKEEGEETKVENDDEVDKSDDVEEEVEEREPTTVVQSVADSEEQTVSIDALIATIDEAAEMEKYKKIVNAKGKGKANERSKPMITMDYTPPNFNLLTPTPESDKEQEKEKEKEEEKEEAK